MDKKKIIVMIISFCLVLGTVSMLVYKEKEERGNQLEESESYQLEEYKQKEYNGKKYSYNTGLNTILFLGIDDDNEENLGQSDMISMILLDRHKEEIKLLMVSRDSMVKIHQYDAGGNDLGWNTQHLALAYSYGNNPKHGAILTVQALSKVLGDIPILNYVALNTKEIAKFQDVIGTLSITLDDDYTDVNSQYKKGNRIELTTNEAESFVRYRNTKEAYSNEKRMKRQKLYMESYMEQLKQCLNENKEETIRKMYEHYRSTATNITHEEIQNFAEMIMTYSFDSNDVYMLEGENKQGKYHDEYILNEEKLEQLVINLFYEEEQG